jgi:hypothetical protein
MPSKTFTLSIDITKEIGRLRIIKSINCFYFIILKTVTSGLLRLCLVGL